MIKKLSLLILVLTGYLALNAQVNGVIINDSSNYKLVKIWGTHHERGFAYGALLGDEITEVFINYLKPQFGNYYPFARDIVTSSQDLSYDSLYVVEAKAIIDGMNDYGLNIEDMDYIDMLVCNSFLDIANLLSKSFGMGCSSLISWGDATTGTDLNGKSVISRHLDWTINSNLINNQVIVINLPSETDEQPWTSIGFAGMYSVLSGFNENIGVFQHMMSDFNGTTSHGKQYEPIWFALRTSIEKLDYNQDGNNDVQDVRSKLMEQTTGFADGFLISAISADPETDSLAAMIAEIAPTEPILVFRNNDYPDSIPGDNLYTANYQIARNNDMHFCSRYNSIIDVISDGTNIGLDENWEMIRDHSHLSHNLQFMQYSPEMDLFKIAVYENGTPAYLNNPKSYSIAELFSNYVGIETTISNNPEIIFYPNPVNDILSISVNNAEISNYNISIFNIYGSNVNVPVSQISKKSLKVDFKALPMGIYIVKINTDIGSSQNIIYKN